MILDLRCLRRFQREVALRSEFLLNCIHLSVITETSILKCGALIKRKMDEGSRIFMEHAIQPNTRQRVAKRCWS
jgi:hypothetical protein